MENLFQQFVVMFRPMQQNELQALAEPREIILMATFLLVEANTISCHL
jgi:hypothetical protein